MEDDYKNSGITWIGKIPNNWSINKVKFLAKEKDSLFIDGDWIESDVIEDKGIRYLTTGNVGPGFYKEQGFGYISEKTFKSLNCLKVYPGDLMISRLNEPIGRTCIVPDSEMYYVVAVDNVILRPDSCYDKRYIMYCMNTDGYAENASEIARGATMQRISRTQLGNFYIPVAPYKEQVLIADFLEEKCIKINSILEDLNSQIDYLDKRKKSLIWETVTKGLNRSVETKESGIDWIGDVPTHYDLKRIKYTATIIGSGGTPDTDNLSYYENGELNWIQSGDLYKTDYVLSTEKKITREATKSMSALKYYSKNFVVVAMYGASVGNTSISLIDAYVNQACCVLKFDNDCLRYMYYAIKSSNEYLLQQAMGGTQPNISQIVIKNTKIPIPPIDEQTKIADFLDEKCKAIDEMIDRKRSAFETLDNYKRSLIYEYVTGKKRVEVK